MIIIFRHTRPTFKRRRKMMIFSPSYLFIPLNLMSFLLSLPSHHHVKTRATSIPFGNRLSDKTTTRSIQTTHNEVGPITTYRIKDDAHNERRMENRMMNMGLMKIMGEGMEHPGIDSN
jgi:hypothetical protein